MRRFLLVAVVLTLAGCAPATARPAPGGPVAATVAAHSGDADLLTAVLRRYLTTPGENSFPGPFPAVYVLDHTVPSAADPTGATGGEAPIAPADQRYIVAALRDVAPVTFVADRADVVVERDGCAQVRGGGILITVGPPDGDARAATVGVFGFVACLGATWLTYVARHDPAGWTVTGTTGPYAIS
jgi:hypothetical protein